MSDQNPNGTAQGIYQQGYVCPTCQTWVTPGLYQHICFSSQPAPSGWRCTCMVFVVPGEEHRCFYRDILNVLERIATQLEKR